MKKLAYSYKALAKTRLQTQIFYCEVSILTGTCIQDDVNQGPIILSQV